MTKLYDTGGFLDQHGITTIDLQYISIYREPENKCEIQNSACGRSEIMMRLEMVKTAEGENEMQTVKYDGTLVLRQLVEPWKRIQRIVCAESYFASVFAK